MKTFEISKLENCKSGINETWPRYVLAEYLSYTKNEDVNEWGGGGEEGEKCATKKTLSTQSANIGPQDVP